MGVLMKALKRYIHEFRFSHYIYEGVAHYAIFIFIDFWTKSALRAARTEQEQQSIWRKQTVVLFLTCIFVYYYTSHIPGVLISLTYGSFMSSLGMNIFQGILVTLGFFLALFQNLILFIVLILNHYVWPCFATRAEDLWILLEPHYRKWATPYTTFFKPQSHSSPPSCPSSTPFTPTASFASNNPSGTAAYSSSLRPYSPGGNPSLYLSSYCGPSMSSDIRESSLIHRPEVNSVLQEEPCNAPPCPAGGYWPVPDARSHLKGITYSSDLQLRPQYPYAGSNISDNSNGSLSDLGSRFFSYLRSGLPVIKNKPRGLINNGNNLCFMNAVFQCLSRTPLFTAELNFALANIQSTRYGAAPAEKMIATAVAGLFKELEEYDGFVLSQVPYMLHCHAHRNRQLKALMELQSSPLSPAKAIFSDRSKFRTTAFSLSKNLVAPPSSQQKQSQQDAAEFTMWLLAVLHIALNKQPPGRLMNYSHITTGSELSSPLTMVKVLYSDEEISKKVAERRQLLFSEIAKATSLDDPKLISPLMNLADLEWAEYSQMNESLIDRKFTGQVAELLQCVACQKITVHIENFTVLPVVVPVVPNLHVLTLDDCFRHFSKIEPLDGKNSLHCDCNNSRILQSSQNTGIWPSNFMNGCVGSGIDPKNFTAGTTNPLMSPISSTEEPMYHDKSSFLMSGQKTSTPFNSPSQKLTEGRKRTIVCRLPECLIVQLMRFRYDRIQRQCNKIHTAIMINHKCLNMTPVTISSQPLSESGSTKHDLSSLSSHTNLYELYGICLHEGGDNTTYGHYFSLALDRSGSWYKLDDEKVTKIHIEHELNTQQVQENAYLLFFNRK